jgi:hypothetical protein
MRLSKILPWALGPLFLLLPLAACLSPTATVAPSPTSLPEPAVYSRQQLQEDFRILRTTLEEALYTRSDRAEPLSSPGTWPDVAESSLRAFSPARVATWCALEVPGEHVSPFAMM